MLEFGTDKERQKLQYSQIFSCYMDQYIMLFWHSSFLRAIKRERSLLVDLALPHVSLLAVISTKISYAGQYITQTLKGGNVWLPFTLCWQL